MKFIYFKTFRRMLFAASLAMGLLLSTACTMSGDYYANGKWSHKKNSGEFIESGDESTALLGSQAVSSDLATASNTTCYIEKTEKIVRCFGSNLYQSEVGLLGNPNFSESFSGNPIAVYKDIGNGLEILGNAQEIVAGTNHFCVSTSEIEATGTVGYVYCWGSNEFGQIGIGSAQTLPTSVQRYATRVLVAGGGQLRSDIANGHNFKLYSGTNHVCVLQNDTSHVDDKVYCWGNNDHEQSGQDIDNVTTIGTQIFTATMVNLGISSSNIPKALALGDTHSCSIVGDPNIVSGTVVCWGQNLQGRLGIDSALYNNEPHYETPHEVVTVNSPSLIPLSYVTHIAAARGTTCTIQNTHSMINPLNLFCWGDGANGELGLEPNVGAFGLSNYLATATVFSQNVGSPIKIMGSAIGNVLCVEATFLGIPHKKCFGTHTASVQLSAGTQLRSYLIPSYITPNAGDYSWQLIGVDNSLSNLSFGSTFGCGTVAGSKVYCWGDNKDLKLGNQVAAPYSTLPVTDESTPYVPVVIYQ